MSKLGMSKPMCKMEIGIEPQKQCLDHCAQVVLKT